MIGPILPLLIGFGIDCVLGDPHSLPHPVVLIGKTISALEDRRISRGGGARAASVFVRQGESVAAPRGRERHVLADLGGKVAAG